MPTTRSASAPAKATRRSSERTWREHPLASGTFGGSSLAISASFFADRKDLGPGARRNVHQTLVKAFTAAVREGLIDRSPLYAAGIKRPSKERQRDIEPLTLAEVMALQEHAPDRMFGLAIKVSAMTGLRAGEVGGLREQDIDFEKCRIHVRQAVHRSRGERGIGPLKTKAARRNIAVPCSVVEEVADFRKENPPTPDGRIFTAKRDHGYLTDVRLNTAVHEAAERAGIRGGAVHFHELRHTYASLLVAAGANIKALQYAMGHTDSRTTTDLYTYTRTRTRRSPMRSRRGSKSTGTAVRHEASSSHRSDRRSA